MLSGLTAETPLGLVVSTRAEDDPEIIKSFSKEQKRVRNEYKRKVAKQKSSNEVTSAINSFKDAFIKLAGGHNDKKT